MNITGATLIHLLLSNTFSFIKSYCLGRHSSSSSLSLVASSELCPLSRPFSIEFKIESLRLLLDRSIVLTVVLEICSSSSSTVAASSLSFEYDTLELRILSSSSKDAGTCSLLPSSWLLLSSLSSFSSSFKHWSGCAGRIKVFVSQAARLNEC